MENLGMIFLNYIPNKAYTIAFPVEFDVEILRDYNIRSVIEIQPEYKQAIAYS